MTARWDTKRLPVFGVILITLFVFVQPVPSADAAVPHILSFQGRLTDANGDLLGGNSGTDYFFTFSIHDALTGGSQLWPLGSPANISAKVTQGVFNVPLGDTTLGFEELDINFDSTPLFLEVSVSSTGASFETMTPRQRLESSPTAINADTVHGGRFISATGVAQFGGLATLSYSRFGIGTTTHGLSTASQVLFTSEVEFDDQVFFDASASIASNFEVVGYASFSQIFGSGLTDCDADGQTLGWDAATGLFMCGDDDIGSGGALVALREDSSSFASISSVSFASPHFDISFPIANEALIRLDWGTGGPASLSQDEIVTGNWGFSGLTSFAGGASFSGIVEISNTASLQFLTLAGTAFIPHDALTLSGTPDYLTLSGQEISLNVLDISDDTNLTVSATGLTLSDDDVTLTAGFDIPLTASISNWETAFGFGDHSIAGYLTSIASESFWDTAYNERGSVIAGTGLTWDGTELDVTIVDTNTTNLGTREGFSGAFTNISSISFNAAHYALDFSGTQASLSLNWGAGGPASLSQDETVSGRWTFNDSIVLGDTIPVSFGISDIYGDSSFPGTLFIEPGAVVEVLGNASISGDFEVDGVSVFSGSITTHGGLSLQFGTDASFSSNLEVAGFASSSQFFGSGLTDCDGAGSKLLWDVTTGTFSCGADANTQDIFAGLEVREGATLLSGITSLSFNPAHLSISASGSQDVSLSLDWGAGGPASLSQDETVTGNWTLAGLTAFSGGASFSGTVEISNTASVSSLTINGLAFNPNDYLLISGGTLTGDLFGTNASLSGTVEATALKGDTLTSDTGLTIAPASALTNIAGSASISTNLEVSGYASVSQFFGANLTDCDSAGSKLVWDGPTGRFSCGLDSIGGIGLIEVRELGEVFESITASVTFVGEHFTVTPGGIGEAIIGLDWGANGPASLSQDETVSGTWTFSNDPVFSSGSGLVTSNSIDWDELVDAMTLDADSTVALSGSTLTFGGFKLEDSSASVSGDFEVAGGIFGAGLTDCDNAAASKLLWDASTGTFSCGSDQSGGGGGGGSTLQVREFGAGFLDFPATISFDATHFALTASGTEDVTIGLDWGSGGPASLSQDETVSGTWTFSNDPVFSSGSGLVTSNSIDWDELVDAMTLDADSTVALSGSTLTFGGFKLEDSSASVSGDFEVAGIASVSSLFIGGVPFDTSPHLDLTGGTLTGDFFGTNASFSGTIEASTLLASILGSDAGLTIAPASALSNIIGAASISTNLEVTGYSSSSALFGSGLIDCDLESQTLLYDSSTGTFSCGTDADTVFAGFATREGFSGAFTSISSISFNEAHFTLDFNSPEAAISLDWGAGGPASLSQNETVTGNWTLAGLTNFTGGASVSGGTFEVSSVASISQLFVGGVEVTGGSGVTSNSIDWDELADAMTLDANTTTTLSGFTLTFGGLSLEGSNASVSAGLEVSGTASISAVTVANAFSGAGLTDCDGTDNKLLWDASTGTFSCGTDNNSGGGGGGGLSNAAMDVYDNTGLVSLSETEAVLNLDTIRASDSAYTLETDDEITFNEAGRYFITGRLQWESIDGAGGANKTRGELRAEQDTGGGFADIDGAYCFGYGREDNTAGKIGDSCSITWVSDYGVGDQIRLTHRKNADTTLRTSADGSGITIIKLGDSDGGGASVAADSIDWAELVDAMTLDASTTTTLGGFTLSFGGLSLEGTNASVSGNLEVDGGIFGAGLTDCDSSGSKLLWDATTGTFSCGGDNIGGGGGALIEVSEIGSAFDTNISSLSFQGAHFDISAGGVGEALIALDWGAGGPASLSQDETVTGDWDFTGSTSFAQIFGAGLTDCDGAGQRLQWTASGSESGKFSCATEESAGANATYNHGHDSPAFGAVTILSAMYSDGGVVDVKADNGFVTEIAMPAPGSIVGCLAVHAKELPNPGEGTVIFSKNGSVIGGDANQYCRITETNASGTDTINDSLLTFSEGDTIGVRVSLSADFDVGGPGQKSNGWVVTWTVQFDADSGGADLAENYYTVDDSIEPGDVVAIDGSLIAGVMKTQGEYDPLVIGIVSTRPGILLDDPHTQPDGARAVPIALSGRIPVKVNMENGRVQAGDYLTTSSTPGVAMKATKAGPIIGQALHDYDDEKEQGTVTIFAKNGYWNGESSLASDSLSTGRDVLAALVENRLSITDAGITSLVSTDRVIAGLDIVAPAVTAQTVTVQELVSSGSLNLTLGEEGIFMIAGDVEITGSLLVGEGVGLESLRVDVHTIASRSDVLEAFEIDTRALLTDIQIDFASQIASVSDDVVELTALVEEINARFSSVSSDALSVADGISLNGSVIIAGGLVVDDIGTPDGEVNFLSDAIFFGRPYFTRDTGGFAIIPAGETEVRIEFEREYLYQPVVNATITVSLASASEELEVALLEGDITYIVTRTDEYGFTIRINGASDVDVPFSWNALAIKGARVFMPSVAEPEPTDDPIEEPPVDEENVPDVSSEPEPQIEEEPPVEDTDPTEEETESEPETESSKPETEEADSESDHITSEAVELPQPTEEPEESSEPTQVPAQ